VAKAKINKEMTDKNLTFKKIKTDSDINKVLSHNADAFMDIPMTIGWSKNDLKKELEDGWEIFSASFGPDIVACLFLKDEKSVLFTKNTPVKLQFQGNGFSHTIKEFYEDEAQTRRIKKIISYCPSNNFRMISLNEGHQYKRTGRFFGKDNEIIEWEKLIG